MKMATTPEEQRRWMEQWRQAAVALEEFRRYELQMLTDTQAWEQIEDLLSLADHYPRRSDTSGLVEQQAWFQRFRSHE
jgi:hypothetical protein